MLYTTGTLVTGETVHSPGWFAVRDGWVEAVGAGPPPRVPDVDLDAGTAGGAVVVPGFVDMHVHGGGGHNYDEATAEAVVTAAGFHLMHGTTTTLASLVSSDLPQLRKALQLISELAADGIVAGVHLEGPWLSPARAGAHAIAHLREPHPREVAGILAEAAGVVRMVTLAPELPGATDSIKAVLDAGAVPAIGHTDASYEQTVRAIQAGATVATHLFNAMPPLHHRDPGPVGALLEDPRVTLELIADGVHLHPSTVQLALGAAGPERVAVVTDATSAAGMSDGSYLLGELEVDVVDGFAKITSGPNAGSIAGGLATMDLLFRAAFAAASAMGRSREEALLAASLSASVVPARALQLGDVGVLAAGRKAHAVVLTHDLQVTDVLT